MGACVVHSSSRALRHAAIALFSLSSQQASWGGLRGFRTLRASLSLTVSIILVQLLGCRLPRERMENDAFSVSSRSQATVRGCTG